MPVRLSLNPSQDDLQVFLVYKLAHGALVISPEVPKDDQIKLLKARLGRLGALMRSASKLLSFKDVFAFESEDIVF